MKFNLRKTFVLIMTVIMVATSVVVPVNAEDDSFEVREYSRYVMEDGKYISGARPDYMVSEIFADFTREDTYKVYSGEILKDAGATKVQTGLTIKNETTGEKCTVVLKGDVSCDGRISSVDYVKVKKAFLGVVTLEGAALCAADVNSDDDIASNDYLLVKKAFIGEDIYKKSIDIELSYVDFTEVKNVIYMIGDGMGPTHIEVARERTGGNINGKLYMDLLPNSGYETTYSLEGVTDSAAGGTALATGYKTYNGVIGLDENFQEIPNIREVCAGLGMKTGVLCTKPLNDATPAAFTAHATARGATSDISRDQIMDMPNVLIGQTENAYGSVMQEQEVQAKWLTYGIQRRYKQTVIQKSQENPLFGTIYTNETIDLPALTKKTLTHLNNLDTEDKGFFVMIEGSKIDTYSHDNNLNGMVGELDAFDEAIGVAMEFILENPDTILIVTADHETGGLQPDGSFTTGGHTGTDCRVMAIGYGTEVFDGVTVNNTDIPKFIASSLGVENFGDPNVPENEYY